MRVSIDKAAELLTAGEVVAVPTETVYGLAASLTNPYAISEIYSLKGRPANNPLIIHLSAPQQIENFASIIPEGFYSLAEAFWPGPFTVVLPIFTDKVPASACAGLPTGAFRVPNHPLARRLIDITGPLVMPSANLSGRPSATCVEHVEKDFGSHFPVLDGGACTCGVESTILYWQQGEQKWQVARLGAIAPEAFQSVLKYLPDVIDASMGGKKPLCPGQLYRHYAPEATLTLARMIPEGAQGVVVGFEDRSYPAGCRVIALGRSSDPETAAHRLYAVLRRLDQEGIGQAWVDIDFPEEGLWLTLKERLIKASKCL